MDYFLIVLATMLIILGLLGCFLPILPGPPLSYLGLLLLSFTRWGNIESAILIWMAIIVVLVTILDYILPVWTTKKIGGTKRGVWGATLGLILGLFIFPPWGIIIGPFVGAFLGEISADKDNRKALKSAIGSFIGFLLGTGLKLVVSGIITYYFVVFIFIK